MPATSRLVEIDLLNFCLKDESWICSVSAQHIKPFSLLFFFFFFTSTFWLDRQTDTHTYTHTTYTSTSLFLLQAQLSSHLLSLSWLQIFPPAALGGATSEHRQRLFSLTPKLRRAFQRSQPRSYCSDVMLLPFGSTRVEKKRCDHPCVWMLREHVCTHSWQTLFTKPVCEGLS